MCIKTNMKKTFFDEVGNPSKYYGKVVAVIRFVIRNKLVTI